MSPASSSSSSTKVPYSLCIALLPPHSSIFHCTPEAPYQT